MALINKKLTDLTEKINVSDDAFIHIVEPNDLTQSASGSSFKAKKSVLSGTVRAQTTVSGTVKTNANSADPIVYLKGEVDTLIINKQNVLGFTPENVSNKQNSLFEDLSNAKYPTVTAVNNALSTKANNTDLNLKSDKANTYDKAEVDNIFASNPNGYTANSTDAELRDRTTHTGVQAIATVTGLQTALDNKADLVAGVVPQNQLPSYVDDVLEFANLASFPATGEIAKIYIALDSNKQYRWSGTIYIQITNGLIASTSDVPEGSNLYFTGARVLATVLSGISFITNRAVVATDSVLVALGLLQKQVSDKLNLTGGNLTGALTINVDSFINGLRIGRGGGNQSTNTANGAFALNANTTGNSNTANGVLALNANTEGSNNTANGSSALQNNTTGSLNTANGVLALFSNTTGGNNTANGVNALFSNTTGINNTANGTSALIANTTGSANTANGPSALQNNTTGSNNTANGVFALLNNTTGSSNIANGINSGRFIANGSTANEITNNSVFLGNNTKALANNQTNQIVIGDNATGAGSNTVTLGNTSITSTILRGTVTAGNGTLLAGTGTTNFIPKFTASGAVGNGSIFDNGIQIKTTSGFDMQGLDKQLTIEDNGLFAGVFSPSFNSSVNNIIKFRNYDSVEYARFSATGNVGINTTTPTERLDVVGNGKFSGIVTAGNGTLLAGTGTTNQLAKFTASGAVGNSSIFDNGTNVGIGTTTPTNDKLEIIGSAFNLGVYRNADFNAVGAASSIISVGQLVGTTKTPAFDLIGLSISAFNGEFRLRVRSSDVMTEVVRINSSGNVGINQPNPTEKLDVVGNGKFSGSINSGSITANGIITGNQIASVSGITGANIRITAIPEYADNAAALANFEPIGRFYRTGDILKVVH
jgi:hypothetical protein